MAEERGLWGGEVEFVPGIIGDAPARMTPDPAPVEEPEIDEQDAVALMLGDLSSLVAPEGNSPEQSTSAEPPVTS
ncbi:hypothetical protein [Actinomadura rupiterrae]|uniref:hypothetical protein n=1 Tax=Actinomadura rupiterrae TaxID=559627 RepID=UPI0020A26567|nr:hypothetical protein [Actinomadura rupiterrae]MCP2337348.1 hypothetical protein [Actinomadura rupiterrae]